jgi:Reverse transcriptase (RNA-dependent DNA polymerase)
VDFLRHHKLLVDVVGGQLIPLSVASAADGSEEVFAVYRRLQQQETKLRPPAVKLAAAGSTQAPLAAMGGDRSYAQAVKDGIGGSGPAGPPGSPTTAASHPAASQTYWPSIVAEFPGVTQPFTVASSPSQSVQHHIITKGRPVTPKFRRLDPARLAAAKAEFSKMLAWWCGAQADAGKARCTWCVKKTSKDKYPLPNMADLSSRLEGCTVFSKLDLQKDYLQVPVSEDDIPKTAIITPFGLFEFMRMPFGLRNAGMTFQRMMDQIFFYLPCVFIYLDDLLVASRSVEEHRRHLRQVLQLLQANGLVINEEKCLFGQTSLEFLGHLVQGQTVSGRCRTEWWP